MPQKRSVLRVSEHFQLGRTQPTLDFVDVNIRGDVRVFVDPRALRLLHSVWADECVSLVQNFFQTVLEAIRAGNDDLAKRLLGVLSEPNETHLGLSREHARGRGLGDGELAGKAWRALGQSEAAKTGLLEDLEDTILMIEGISSDIISDITTNIIREPLIHYTQGAAALYGIPLTPDVESGPLWDPHQRQWYSELTSLPMGPAGKLLLVPKVLVRRKMDYDTEEYYRHYLLVRLQQVELAANSELVQLLKNGRSRVTKKSLAQKYGAGKKTIVEQTRLYPDVLQRYRADKRQRVRPPLNHTELATAEDSKQPDWPSLLDAVTRIPPGRQGAADYEKAVEALLSALFYPSLANPQVQKEIHEGRKRIDITYTNAASEGFFYWLALHYPSAHVFVECKNYAGDPGNPELDQLVGRFSPTRGKFGILACRTLANKDLFVQRCRDSADDDHGFIVPIDDDDLRKLVDEQTTGRSFEFSLLKNLLQRLVM